MNKKTIVSLLVFAALGVATFVLMQSPEKGQRVGEKPRPMVKLKTGEFDTIEVSRGAATARVTTRLKKDGETYKVTSPLAYAADSFAGKQAFEAIEKLEFGDLVSEQKAKHAEFEVGDDGVRVVVKKGDAQVADLIVGKSQGTYTMVRPGGQDQVWQAVGALKATFDKDTAAWRDKTIVSFKPEDAERIEVTTRGKPGSGAIILTRPAKGDAGAEPPWSVQTSDVKIDNLDKTVADGVVSALASLKASDFADAPKPEDTGLADPDTKVVIALAGGKTAGVAIGKKKGDDDFYAKSLDGTQVFLVKKYAVERLVKRPLDFRDKTMCDLAETDVTDVSVTQGADSFALAKKDGTWKATKPASLTLDDTKVSGIVGAFKAWKGTGFADDVAPKATGLGTPRATVVARAGKKTCTVKVGGETADKSGYHMQVAGAPDVLVAAKWSVDRLLKKPDDLKKK